MEADSQKGEDKTFFEVDSEKYKNQHIHEWVNIERSLNKLKEEFLTNMKMKLDLETRKLRKEENQTTNGVQVWVKETLMYIFLVLLEHSSSISSFDLGLYDKNTFKCPVKNLHHVPMFLRLLLFVGCLTSKQQASVSQGRICSDNFTCCHTEIEVADQTFYLTQSQYTDTGPTSPSADPITTGAWQGSHWSANF